jgi:hypothetical protein
MGDRRLYKIECFHMISTPESEQLKVAALNLFHPAAPPPFKKSVSSYCDTVSHGERGRLVLVMVIPILDFI